ncbi:MAG: hypothetical protein ACNA8W_11610 [Bradymonadaceae bacterium]
MNILIFLFAYLSIFILTTGLGIVLYKKFTRGSLARLNAEMGEFADQHDLTYVPAAFMKQPRLAGTYMGFEIEVLSVVRTSNRSQTFYVVHKARLPSGSTPVGLVMFHEGLLSQMGKVLGREDVQSGIVEIDEAFIIRGVSEDEAQAFLSRPGIRWVLMKLIETDKNMRLENNELLVETEGRFGDVPLVHDRLNMIVEYARILSSQAPATTVAPSPPPQRTPPGDLGSPPEPRDSDRSNHW